MNTPDPKLTREKFIIDLAADPNKYSVEVVIRALTDRSFVPTSCDFCGGTGEVQGKTYIPWDTIQCPECNPDPEPMALDDCIPF